MKKNLLTIFTVVLAVTGSKAQPVITSANMYAIGDELIMQHADTAGVSDGTSGANQIWDFSSLVNSGPQTSQSVVAAAGTPYASSFPSADMAVDAGGGNYGYFDASGNDFFLLGAATPSTIVPYSDPQKFITFPLTYNTTFTDNLAANYEVSGFPASRTGTVTFTVDGYGTLKLPTGTHNNVLRFKVTQNITDVISIIPVAITSTQVTTTYGWMTPGNKNALLDISHITLTSTGLTIYSNTVFYYPGAVSAESPAASDFNLQVFPNPSPGKVQLNATLHKPGNLKISVWDIRGSVLKNVASAQVAAGLYMREIDLTDLPDGLYFLKLDVDGLNVAAKSIVLQR